MMKKRGFFSFLFHYSEIDNEINSLYAKLEALGGGDYDKAHAAIKAQNEELNKINLEISKNTKISEHLKKIVTELTQNRDDIDKKLNTATKKLQKSKEIYKSINHSIDTYFETNCPLEMCRIPGITEELENLAPSVILKLHSMDIQTLRKVYRENDKQIQKLMEKYASRYTTKANQAIYKLMVIALRAELQNILVNLKYERLETAIEQVKNVTSKYLAIVSEGNQSIAPTMTKFIGELEYLFINAAKIEYNYYVKKEQAKQEQLAIREQMRQEAEERKALEAERKKIEAEETKYFNIINEIKEKLMLANEQEKEALEARILELQGQLSDIIIKKDEITKLQNGKAGHIYIISNLGSFGENMFKIGMTRRINPQERVNELGDASVPFKFDVHSFIFSDDAVSLENKIHKILEAKRVNKVNSRKEFFYSSVDELETIVNDLDPSAEFIRTMAADDYRQSLSSDEIYTSEFTVDNLE